VEDKVRGLSLGGDDYVSKPFSLEEVVARIQVILRRQGMSAGSSRFELADLEMDDDAHLVRRAGQVIDLSPTEYKLLRFLLVNAGRVLSRNQILDHVWHYDFGGHATAVETYISYLPRRSTSSDLPSSRPSEASGTRCEFPDVVAPAGPGGLPHRRRGAGDHQPRLVEHLPVVPDRPSRPTADRRGLPTRLRWRPRAGAGTASG
jgi:hypothetical protein